MSILTGSCTDDYLPSWEDSFNLLNEQMKLKIYTNWLIK